MVNYSDDEIAKHNNKNSAWVAIENKVYDVTEFIEEHPGGEDVLLEHAGTDSTEDFKLIGHTLGAKEHMKKFLIGYKGEEGTDTNGDCKPDSVEGKQEDEENQRTVFNTVVPIFMSVAFSLGFLYVFS